MNFTGFKDLWPWLRFFILVKTPKTSCNSGQKMSFQLANPISFSWQTFDIGNVPKFLPSSVQVQY